MVTDIPLLFVARFWHKEKEPEALSLCRTWTIDMTPIYFYYPKDCCGQDIPECDGQYLRRYPGNYIWTVKTYGYLKRAGFCCELTSTLPTEGIILTHRDFLSREVRPGERQLLVCIVADTCRHPYAQIHVVQNPSDPLVSRGDPIWPSYFIPHWTESGLIVRDPSHGGRFEHVSYFGSIFNLAPQLRDPKWSRRLQAMGFRWEIKRPESWNDYSDTDVIVAVRSYIKMPYYRTPATKLYNAWTAGVPAILGHESACRCERRGPLDYIEVGNTKEILCALDRLREDEAYRRSIVENGWIRAKEVQPQRTTEKWISLLQHTLIPAYHDWRQENAQDRQGFLRKRFYSYAAFMTQDVPYRLYWKSMRWLSSLR